MIKNKLAKATGVNLKSQEMYDDCVKQKQENVKRQNELQTALEKCNAVYEYLESCKFNKVDFTFRQVAKYFEEIFPKLVPRGMGRLSFERQPSQGSESDSSRSSK